LREQPPQTPPFQTASKNVEGLIALMAPKTVIANITHTGRRWVIGALLVVLLGVGLGLLVAGVVSVPWSGQSAAPLSIARIAAPAPDMVVVDIVNNGPAPVTLAQVLVDGAYWEYIVAPGPELSRRGRATLRIPYPWVPGQSHRVVVLTSSGATVEGLLPGAPRSATSDPPGRLRPFLLGLGVGAALLGLGVLWHRRGKAA
jgi:zinc transporter, ZIP family